MAMYYETFPRNENGSYSNKVNIKNSDTYTTIIPSSLSNSSEMMNQCNRTIQLFYNNIPCYEYLSLRKKAISYIKDIVNVLNYSKIVFYKAILYLDLYYLHKQFYNVNIYQISTICILISLQFNECCSYNNNIKELFTLLHFIPHFLELEQDILKTLNYDLGVLTVYDYINTFFLKGVLFTKSSISQEDKFEAEYVLSCAMDILWVLIDDDCFLDFTPYIMAVTIIRIALEKNAVSFDDIHFQEVHDINFKQIKYVQCLFVLKAILPYVMIDNKESNFYKYSNINNNKFCITNMNKRDCYQYSISQEYPSSSTLDSNYSL